MEELLVRNPDTLYGYSEDDKFYINLTHCPHIPKCAKLCEEGYDKHMWNLSSENAWQIDRDSDD